VVVVTTSRADLGPLSSVVAQLLRDPVLRVELWTGVGLDEAGLRQAFLDEGVDVTEARVTELAPQHDVRDPGDAATAGAALAAGTAAACARELPGAALVLGDRWELLSILPALVLAAVPVVHVHGGEVTAGAVDERVRHAVTKLADEHCVADEDAARRVRQLGEHPDRVHVTGAPGLDRLRNAPEMSDEDFLRRFGRAMRRPLVLCTVHPETAGGSDVAALSRTVLRAVVDVAGVAVVTHPGQDAGRGAVLSEIAAVADLDNVVVVPSLGGDYVRLLRTADVVVGNSSSGLIEAPAAGVPSVDVGDRQRGRRAGPGVFRVPARPAAVRGAVQDALRRGRSRTAHTPLAAPAIAARVRNASGLPTTAKEFVDAAAPAAVRTADELTTTRGRDVA